MILLAETQYQGRRYLDSMGVRDTYIKIIPISQFESNLLQLDMVQEEWLPLMISTLWDVLASENYIHEGIDEFGPLNLEKYLPILLKKWIYKDHGLSPFEEKFFRYYQELCREHRLYCPLDNTSSYHLRDNYTLTPHCFSYFRGILDQIKRCSIKKRKGEQKGLHIYESSDQEHLAWLHYLKKNRKISGNIQICFSNKEQLDCFSFFLNKHSISFTRTHKELSQSTELRVFYWLYIDWWLEGYSIDKLLQILEIQSLRVPRYIWSLYFSSFHLFKMALEKYRYGSLLDFVLFYGKDLNKEGQGIWFHYWFKEINIKRVRNKGSLIELTYDFIQKHNILYRDEYFKDLVMMYESIPEAFISSEKLLRLYLHRIRRRSKDEEPKKGIIHISLVGDSRYVRDIVAILGSERKEAYVCDKPLGASLFGIAGSSKALGSQGVSKVMLEGIDRLYFSSHIDTVSAYEGVKKVFLDMSLHPRIYHKRATYDKREYKGRVADKREDFYLDIFSYISNHLSVSALMVYIACPYAFFLKYIVNVRGVKEREAWYSEREKGILLHQTIQDYLLKKSGGIGDFFLQHWKLYRDKHPAPSVDIQDDEYKRWRAILESYSVEIERYRGVVGVEQVIKREKDGFILEGRCDIKIGSLGLIELKTSSFPTSKGTKKLFSNRHHMQLLLYMWVLGGRTGSVEGGIHYINRDGFMCIKETKFFINREKVDMFMKECLSLLRMGYFPRSPEAEPIKGRGPCFSCSYRDICSLTEENIGSEPMKVRELWKLFRLKWLSF